MQKFVKAPLIFLFVGSVLGAFLRWHLVSPVSHINYMYFLHAHSHIMFLGWISNALFIGFTLNHILESRQRSFRNLFMVLQALIAGMMISFPLQGYGVYSIVFSTLHTLVAILFIVKFFRHTKPVSSVSAWYARVAFIFFIISTAGPFSLGYLMSAGLGQTIWYQFSIYFYLHFQYNGFFLFGVLSLFFDLLEKRHAGFDIAKAKTAGVILAATCVPAYLLSVLWATPGYAYNVMAGAAALAQVLAVTMLAGIVIKHADAMRRSFGGKSIRFMFIVFIAFTMKLLLQVLSAFPSIVQFAYALRPVIIAYLHLVLVGVISLSLLVWLRESRFPGIRFGDNVITLFVFFFLGMELCLVVYPWWGQVFGPDFPSAATLTFFFSAALSLSCFLLLMPPRIKD